MSLKTDVWRSHLRPGYLCTTRSSGWIANSMQANARAPRPSPSNAERSSANHRMMTMPFVRSLPKGASLLNLFKAFPETSVPLIRFHEALLRGPSPFTEGERELIAAYVSGLNHCRYCHGVHSATAELLGIKRGRCGRTHCRYTGPYYLAMIAPVLVLASGVVSVDDVY